MRFWKEPGVLIHFDMSCTSLGPASRQISSATAGGVPRAGALAAEYFRRRGLRQDACAGGGSALGIDRQAYYISGTLGP